METVMKTNIGIDLSINIEIDMKIDIEIDLMINTDIDLRKDIVIGMKEALSAITIENLQNQVIEMIQMIAEEENIIQKMTQRTDIDNQNNKTCLKNNFVVNILL